MPSRTYVEQRLGALAGLLKVHDLAGYRLEPHPHFRVRDRYFDTDDGELLRRGMCLRVREREGERRALLRPIRPGDEGPTVEVMLEGADKLESLNPLRSVLLRLTGAPEPPTLHPLLRIRQDRTPRAAFEGDRFVALLSFDVVVFELPDGPHVSNELDIELADEGREADLHALDPFLRTAGLEAVERTKVERGIEKIPRRVTQPLLLLPHERDVLEEVISSGDALHQRRARVLLLDARGFRSSTIANQLGLSTARVRHWKQMFREQRLGVFEGAAVVASESPAYTVSELVTGAPDGPFAPPRTEPPTSDVPDRFAKPDEPTPVESGGDGATPDLASLAGDLDDLLDLFQPGETDTPLLTEEEDFDSVGEEEPRAEAPEEASADVHEEADLPDFRPIVDSQVEVESASALSEKSSEEDPEDTEAAPSAEGPIEDEVVEGHPVVPATRSSIRRPRLHPDDTLVAAAHEVLAYHVSQLGWCAADLDRDRGPYRLYLAVHRVRLALEVFAPVLPADAVSRLHGGLRRLAVGLGRALDLERDPSAEASERRLQALGAVKALLEGKTFSRWIGRAQRLVDRLASQHEAGTDTPDDAPRPWDNYVGEVDDQPSRSRLRHILGTALWSRVEGVLVWERGGDPPSTDDAYPLALACSGIRFVLGLSEQAAPEQVREADGLLETIEAEFMRAHRGASGDVVVAWNRFRGEETRSALAEVLRRL